MPYISSSIQEEYKLLLDPLIEKLKRFYSMGDIEFCIFYILQNLTIGEYRKFTVMNSLVGVLETTKAEFIRRILGPYEDLKLIDNWSEGTPED